MKNKILMISLGILCVLLVFETGYLIGIGERRAAYPVFTSPSRACWPERNIYPGCYTASRVERKLPIQKVKKSFFVAAMTSRETPRATIVTINLPGLEKTDIKIEAKGQYLTVYAGQRREVISGNKDFYQESSSAASFAQSISLPENVRPEDIRAEFNKDNLTISIPKNKRSKKVSQDTVNIPIR